MNRLIQMISFVALSIALASSLVAQPRDNLKSENIDGITYTYYDNMEIELRPATLRNSDLGRRFFTDQVDLKNGNAATYYYRAFMRWQSQPYETRRLLSDNWEAWLECPSEDLPVAEIEEFLAGQAELFDELQIAVERRDCEWDHDFSSMTYTDFIRFELIEANLMRHLGYINRLRTKVEISKCDFDSAAQSINRGMKMAQDIARIPMLVAGLVGESIARTTLQSSIELSQAEGSPNLRSALQSLPNPFVDFLPHLQAEYHNIERNFRFLDSPETSNRSELEWRQIYQDAVAQLDTVFEENVAFVESAANSRPTRTAMLMARLYPIAKRELVKAGWDKIEVDAMPVGQVVAIQTRAVWNEVVGSLDRIKNLPDLTAIKVSDQQRSEFLSSGFDTRSARGEFLLDALISPNQHSFFPSTARLLNRKIALFQNVETIRDFVGRTGELPESLEQLADFNLLPDPANGMPFEYTRKSENVAVLQTETRGHRNYPKNRTVQIRIEMKLTKN